MARSAKFVAFGTGVLLGALAVAILRTIHRDGMI